jgi:hypothetical protein
MVDGHGAGGAGPGVEVDEAVAARHPFKQEVLHATNAVLDDGTIVDWEAAWPASSQAYTDGGRIRGVAVRRLGAMILGGRFLAGRRCRARRTSPTLR